MGGVTNAEVARWAATQQLAIVLQATDGYFDLGGDLHGRPWRLECGPAARGYVRGLELRGRADMDADTDAAVMVLNRALLESLEGLAYEAITDTLQTTVNADLPEEIRWLAMYEEVSWPGLPASFRQHFAVVAEHAETAQRWVQAPLVSQLLDIAESEDVDQDRAQSPVLLMLVRGKVYLRMEHTRRTLAEVAYATHALLVAAQSAMQHVAPMPAQMSSEAPEPSVEGAAGQGAVHDAPPPGNDAPGQTRASSEAA
ncbi:hypothetical protein [Acidovorax sp. BL-A-41-H1]|uniref:hypothetical protein n=1 Tax=Acidovorax sp. BL-A-41-H1 TaxID=3421102 RepID=UPI003F79E3FE